MKKRKQTQNSTILKKKKKEKILGANKKKICVARQKWSTINKNHKKFYKLLGECDLLLSLDLNIFKKKRKNIN